LTPHAANRPSDVRAAFHLDKIQAIVSRYASEPFEIGVGFEQREGCEHAVIVIPDGVKSPVAAKRDLIHAGRTLIGIGDVFFRTLRANGTPSTARARPEDWPDIVEICFQNKEADFGGFLRRQLAGQTVSTLLRALAQLGASTPPAPTLRERAVTLLKLGEKRFKAALANRTTSEEERRVVDAATWSIAVVIEPYKEGAIPSQTFLNTAMSSNPAYTGWPAWIDSRFFTDQSAGPKVSDNAWEALVISAGQYRWSDHLDFWRLDPKGEFYLLRNLQDDVAPNVPPRSSLNPLLVLRRVTEVLAVGLTFAKGLGWDIGTTKLGFAFRWTTLRGRRLQSWVDPFAVIGGGTANDDEITTTVELNLDTPPRALAPAVNQATQGLFILFDGAQVPLPVIEDIVRLVLARK
jgi:hypothetical protein